MYFHKPLVSVIMSTRNHGYVISRAIKSVLDQNYTHFEFFIINDGSTDFTEDVLHTYACKDARIIILHNKENIGVPKSFNRALKRAKGIYVARIDSDDAWIGEDKLQKQVNFLECNTDYVAVGGGMIVIDARGKELFRYLKPETDKDTRKHALTTNPIANSTSLCRTETIRMIGGCNEDMKYNEDWDFWLRIGLQGKFYNFPEFFAYYTTTSENKSVRFLRRHTFAALKVIWCFRYAYPSFTKGFIVNCLQLCYSIIPVFLRMKLGPSFSHIKKKIAGS